MQSWKDYLPYFEGLLAEQNKEEKSPKELYDPIRYFLALGGKRIRPIAALITADMFAADKKQASHLAMAIEVFHNFTLVHDDIMDEAKKRRNQATVHEKWNRDIAILSGDVMLVNAYQHLEKIDYNKVIPILSLFNKTAVEVCEGQQLDMNFETETDVSIEEYIQMISLKTSVLLAASLKLGTMLGDATKEEANLMYDFGKNLGIAFQIQDDLLDAFGEEETFGKKIGGDIIANKKTFLYLKALELADITVKEKLEQVASEENETSKIENTLAIYQQLDVKAITEKEIKKYFNKAVFALSNIKRESPQKQILENLALFLIKRTV